MCACAGVPVCVCWCASVCVCVYVCVCVCADTECIAICIEFMVLQEVVPVSLLKEHLEVDTLEAVGLIPSAKVFNQKFVKMKTRLL